MSAQIEIGYLYCMSNPAMPGLVKIGYTNRHPTVRANELYFGSKDTNATGVPLPFKVVKDWRIPSNRSYEVEQAVHRKLHAHRVQGHGNHAPKEFFHLNPVEAISRIEEALFDLDWWSVTQAQVHQFEDAVRERDRIAKTTKKAALLHDQWLFSVRKEADAKVALLDQSVDVRFHSAGVANGLKWAAIWFAGSAVVFFGFGNAKDGALWICIILAVIAYYFTNTNPAIAHRGSDQHKKDVADARGKALTEAMKSVDIACPNDDCKKRLVFIAAEFAQATNVRCPACGAKFVWPTPSEI